MVWAEVRREVHKITGRKLKPKTIKKRYEGGIRQLLDAEVRAADAAADLRKRAIDATITEHATQQITDETVLCRNARNIANGATQVVAQGIAGMILLMKDINAALSDPIKRAALVADPNAGMQLYFQGKLIVTGDPMLAMKLQQLFDIARPK